MSKKKAEKCFSAKFVKAVSAVVKASTADGSCIPREAVAAELSGAFTQNSDNLLTMMVGEAVRCGEVAGVAARRGPGGGLYHVASWEKAHADAE